MPSGFSRTSAEQGVGASADTISNYSRPSRVKKYQDTESELSYHSGVSSSNSFAHQNMSASQQFPQPYAPYPGYPPMGLPMGPPMMGMPYPTKHRSGSSIGSHDNMQPGWHSQSDSKWVTPSVSFPPPHFSSSSPSLSYASFWPLWNVPSTYAWVWRVLPSWTVSTIPSTCMCPSLLS